MEGGSVLYNVVVPKCIDAPCSCLDSVHRLNAIEAGLASQIEALALKERMAFHIIFSKKHKRLECVPSRERSHIPPNRKRNIIDSKVHFKVEGDMGIWGYVSSQEGIFILKSVFLLEVDSSQVFFRSTSFSRRRTCQSSVIRFPKSLRQVVLNPGVRLRPLDPDVSETCNNLVGNYDIFSRESL